MPRHLSKNPLKAHCALSEDFSFRNEVGFANAETENPQLKLPQKKQTSTKLPHFISGFLSVQQVAEKLGKSKTTITRWCETGKLSSIPKSFGVKTTYVIAPQAVELLLLQQEGEKETASVAPQAVTKPHAVLGNGHGTRNAHRSSL